MQPCAARVPFLLLLLAPCASFGAEEYWAYSYKNIDVTAAGTSAYAVNLAHYCARLDVMLSRILGIKTQSRAPTHIYAMPQARLQQFIEKNFSSSYRTSGYDNTILMDSASGPDARPYWGAYFGYTATLLMSAEVLRGPDWYMVGVPSVFADSVFEGGHVKIGNVTPGFAYTLLSGGALIPMRAFLTLKQSDAQLKGARYVEMYDAESWYLAREIFVEGKHRAEFGRYLDLMRQGRSEPEAFAASFKITYEDLDKELVLAMRDHAHVYIMEAPADAAGDRASARRLSAAEVSGRLALASVRYQRGPDPVQLANQALQAEPANESALRALAQAQLARGAYGEALAAVDKLAAQGASAAASADSAAILAGLARAAASGRATLSVDAATLKRRAKEAYERAIAADSEDRRSRDGLTRLDGSQ